MPACFAPIIDEHTKVLIIGTMPGVASLKAQEYYAYKYNVFWRIIGTIAGTSEFRDYAHKKEILKILHLGLWDNLRFCERVGSMYSQITKEQPNDFDNLLKQNPQIQKLLFNGQKSYQFFKKYHSNLVKKYNYAVLPSTSPANARLCYSKKLALWRQEID